MKNRLTNLNDVLFEQLDRLNDDELTGEELVAEIKRTKAVTGVSTQIIENSKVALEGAKLRAEYRQDIDMPNMLENKGPLERDDG